MLNNRTERKLHTLRRGNADKAKRQRQDRTRCIGESQATVLKGILFTDDMAIGVELMEQAGQLLRIMRQAERGTITCSQSNPSCA